MSELVSNNDKSTLLVGIDFGTTNTVITYFVNNKANILMDGIFRTVPSKIAKVNDKFYCGNYIPINCQNIIHSFKISISDDINFVFESDDFGVKYTHNDLLVIFFNHLYELINKNFKTTNNIIKAVITVPSNFNDKQREIIRGCFELVKINVIRIINEPSAAALAYGLNYSSNINEKILVIDTGGGTMDFTILEKSELFFEVIHSDGLNNLGGNNFTQLIYDDIIKVNKLKDDYNKTVLWNAAQKIKEKLSWLDTYEIKINNSSYNLTKTKFENLSQKLINIVEQTLTNIIETYSNINYIILVGGSSQIPIIQQAIKKITNKTPWLHPHLESVVAEGAGLYAGIIENKFTTNEDVILMDVVPLSLGVELADGSFSIIIPKNTPLPVKRTQKYTTDSPADSDITIKIYQGERTIANKNFLIGEFVFDQVHMGGVPIIEISFKIDLNSIINITIIDRKSGVEKVFSIKDLPKFDIEQLDKIIKQSNTLIDTDNEELIKIQHIYLITTYIENVLINLQINELISDDDKNAMLEKFQTIEEQIDTMSNLQLIETLKYLQDKYTILGTNNNLDESDDVMDDVEKVLFNERKQELSNRIKLLLVKNPDWEEFLQPCIEELSYNTVSSDFINDKLKLLEELENENKNSIKDYKQEVNNLCLYLKSELESGALDLDNNKTNLLIILLNENIEKIEKINKNINENINWEEQLNIINKKCEEIYNL